MIAIVKLFYESIHMPILLLNIINFTPFLILFIVVLFIMNTYVYLCNGKGDFLSECTILKFTSTLSRFIICNILMNNDHIYFLCSSFDDVLSNFEMDLVVPFNALLYDVSIITHVLNLVLIF